VSSARALRDTADFENVEEGWLLVPGPAARKRSASSFGPKAGAVLVLLTCSTFLLLRSGDKEATAPAAGTYARPIAKLGNRLAKAMPGQAAVSFRENFQTGLEQWAAGTSSLPEAGEWSVQAGSVRPGRLRLWKPTLGMVDYQLEFQGQIETKAVSWAFRASDSNNYYAAKIAISKPGQQLRANIVRYAVVGGREQGRVQLPMPIQVTADTSYLVKMRVKGNRFSTMVNGQVVDSWTDGRLRAGGIGLFSEPGERALISAISLSDQRTFVERLFHLSFLIGPAQMPVW